MSLQSLSKIRTTYPSKTVWQLMHLMDPTEAMFSVMTVEAIEPVVPGDYVRMVRSDTPPERIAWACMGDVSRYIYCRMMPTLNHRRADGVCMSDTHNHNLFVVGSYKAKIGEMLNWLENEYKRVNLRSPDIYYEWT